MSSAKVVSEFFMLVLGLAVALTCSGCARHSDRDWLLREFEMPQEVELKVTSSPDDDTNWADRKNLLIIGTFKFTPTQLLSYTDSIEHDSRKWHALPLSDELKAKLQKRFDSKSVSTALQRAAHGFYLVRSANGKNLLKTSKRSEWTEDSPDAELAILNADSAELNVFVKQ